MVSLRQRFAALLVVTLAGSATACAPGRDDCGSSHAHDLERAAADSRFLRELPVKFAASAGASGCDLDDDFGSAERSWTDQRNERVVRRDVAEYLATAGADVTVDRTVPPLAPGKLDVGRPLVCAETELSGAPFTVSLTRDADSALYYLVLGHSLRDDPTAARRDDKGRYLREPGVSLAS